MTIDSLTVTTSVFGEIAVRDDGDRQAALERAILRANNLAADARSENTRRAYRTAWKQFTDWCQRLRFHPLEGEADVIGMYLADRSETLALASLRVHLAAIIAARRIAGTPIDAKDPRIADVMRGVARRVAGKSQAEATPALLDDVCAMVRALPDSSPWTIRNRAVLWLGFGAALRRSELVALNIGDVSIVSAGLQIDVRRSKTDQTGKGHLIAVARGRNPDLCPVVAVERWREARAIDRDDPNSAKLPLFVGLDPAGRLTEERLGDRAVARIVRSAARAAGLPSGRWSGHSLRAGLVTSAVLNGSELADAMRQARQVSVQTAKRYYRIVDAWRRNVTVSLFNSSDRSHHRDGDDE